MTTRKEYFNDIMAELVKVWNGWCASKTYTGAGVHDTRHTDHLVREGVFFGYRAAQAAMQPELFECQTQRGNYQAELFAAQQQRAQLEAANLELAARVELMREALKRYKGFTVCEEDGENEYVADNALAFPPSEALVEHNWKKRKEVLLEVAEDARDKGMARTE